VVTDPPYFANVQYAELMDFCYVWLRRLVGESNGAFALPSTRHPDELTGNATRARGLPEFTEGLATAMKRVASSLKPGAPLAFTYHHNLLEAYMPVVVALLDARLVATASLPCPAEMGASIHINGTGSSIVDTVFVCRASGVVWRRTLPSDSAGVASLVMDDVTHLKAAGLSPTAGDIRCIAHGHIARIVLWRLRPDWQAEAPTDHKLARVTEGAASLGGLSGVTRHLKPLLARTSQHQAWSVREGSASYGEDDEIRF
jgi:hypothetical protein